ncbi:hypothetical protein GHT06_018301 [Daphnia sinensis]|uniref:Gamma-butyrobetaine dioxygenase n=1 Tax=Daphnia sinensis TaxID=1820382 RepID=A0AAD5L5R4_9CRUS|nr:hypothetical protein GHT06_018301 [Daphnia sinensis]
MAAKYFIRNITSCLSRATISSQNAIKQFPYITNFLLSNRQVSTACPVGIEEKRNRLVVQWKENLTDEYPLVWLRDNCQCSACFDQSSQSRTINFSQFQLNQALRHLTIHDNNVEVHWVDGHKSQNWLKTNKAPYTTWDADCFKSLPVFDFNAIMKEDNILLDWLETLGVWGVGLIKDAPHGLGQVGSLAKRVAFVRKTHYGEEFSVQAKADATNVAYTQGYLQLHTDLPYYEYKPGINLLHCHIQYKGNGGDSLLTDGFKIAEKLRENDPETYKCLAETKVTWSDIGQENGNHFHKIHHAPVICESDDGTIRRINYSQPQRDSHMAVPIDQVEKWYRALKKFYDLATDARYLIEFKLKPGELVTFDNLRILHGRTAFGENLKGERHVQGAYLDWDEARSRIRVLKAKLLGNKE